MKILSAVFLSILFLALNAFPQVKKEESNIVPKAATIKITLLDLPGVNLEKSKWELAYELRIIDEKEMGEAMVNGRLDLDADKKIGEFLGKGSFTKSSLSKKENREVILTVPLDEKVQKKLADDLESQIKLDALIALNKHTAASLAERRMKTQQFVMYANALIYDAKLKKNIIVPFNWVLSFTRFTRVPNASFETTLQIKENGDFEKRWILPERPKNSMTITTKQ